MKLLPFRLKLTEPADPFTTRSIALLLLDPLPQPTAKDSTNKVLLASIA